MPTLVVKYKDGSRAYPLKEGVPVFIGRAKECDIHLPSPAVSRRHAVVIFKNGICGIKDLGSFNGTMVNGKALTSAEHLTDADMVRISSFVFRLDASDANVQPKTGPRKGTTVLMPQDKLRAALNNAAEARNITIAPETPAPDATTPEAPSPEPPARDEPSAADGAGLSVNKPLRRDSRTFPNSVLPLPRAMAPDGDVGKMLEDLPEQEKRGGPDTVAFVKDTRALHPVVSGGGPDSTAEVVSPADFARTLAKEAQRDVEAIMPPSPSPPPSESGVPREGCNYFDTDYFRDEPEAETMEHADGQGEESEEAEPSADAERIIPLNEPEHAPQLTLDWDDEETNRALEALVADVSRDVSALRDARMAAMESVPDEAFAAPAPRMADTGDFDAVALADSVPAEDGNAAGENAAADAPPPAGPDEAPAEAGGDGAEEGTDAGFSSSSDLSDFSNRNGAFFAGKASVPGVEAVLIPPSLMAAINARLSLYPLLLDLAEERKLFRMANPNPSPEVAAELNRQDAELDSLPGAEEADRLLSALDARMSLGMEDETLAQAEEMAESQWRLIRDSNRETLPAVYKEAYKLGADEPLARALSGARINHGRLFGGAVYLLALEVIAETAQAERKDIAARMRRIAGQGGGKEGGGIFGRLGAVVGKVTNRNEIREETRRLEERDRENAAVVEQTMRESAFMEKTLIREFRQIYSRAAAHFVRKDGEMPLAVRAFFRYGAIGFKPWWMPADVRAFIERDCRDNVVPSIETGPGAITVLYADEYLSAVADMECAPFPDESLAGREKNSREWKTDRAYRRIVNSRSYTILMEDMLNGLDEKLRKYDEQSEAIDKRIAELKARPFANSADTLFGLETDQQAIAIRKTNMQKHIKRIEKEVVASILESVEESEGRFRRGELTMPDAGTLVTKEVESLADIAGRIGGVRARFAPLTVREHMKPGAMNDRETVAARLRDLETADPGVFVSTVIPAKKRENRVELRISPVMVIVPGTGMRGVCAMPREGMEGGRLAVPVRFSKEDAAENAFAGLFADFRWETSRMQGGRDVMNSETLAGAFMRFRWDWRNEPKTRREKGLVLNELSDKRNWRRVYAVFLSDALHSTRHLPVRNPELYENVIVPYLG